MDDEVGGEVEEEGITCREFEALRISLLVMDLRLKGLSTYRGEKKDVTMDLISLFFLFFFIK